jgi:hypothetical protein
LVDPALRGLDNCKCHINAPSLSLC